MKTDVFDLTRKMFEEKYPSFKYLLGCYFHQDWMYEYSDWESAIDDYIQGNQIITGKDCMIVRELEDILKNFSEEQLREMFHYISVGICVESEGYTNSEWLKTVLQRIKLALHYEE